MASSGITGFIPIMGGSTPNKTAIEKIRKD